MDQAAALRNTLAGFLGVSTDTLTPDFSLGATKLNSSIQRAMLYAQLRSQAGLSVRGMPAFKTFGELESQLLGKSESASRTAGARASSPALETELGARTPAPPDESPISCGIDIESVASLPATTDHWEHDFYTSNFTREEIAFCLLQGKPALHLAGRWCVKEALKKCDPRFLAVAMNQIEVRADPAGAPTIWDLTGGTKRRLNYAVSLSHTDDFAVGTVVRVSAGAIGPAVSSPAAPASSTPPASPTPVSTGKKNLLGIAGVLIGLFALAVALYSMWRPH
jgi:phosphopantetheine--protein transferase-like protein